MENNKEIQRFDAPASIVTRDIEKFEEHSQNVYEAIAIIAKRANQVGSNLKLELDQRLQEFTSVTDSLEEIFENREQIELSRQYERMPKPTAIAMEEFLSGKVYFRKPAEGEASPA